MSKMSTSEKDTQESHRRKIHFLPDYLLNPTHPVTVCLIGCGGTGSQVLTALARINYSLQALGHPGLYVITYDPDEVSESNVGRQLFSPPDIGRNKAILLTTRVNAFYGTAWEAVPDYFNEKTGIQCNFTLSCVDNIKSRLEISALLKEYAKSSSYREPYMTGYYWLDFGNGRDTGQVALGSLDIIKQPESDLFDTVNRLPLLTERFKLEKVREEDSGPSCSHADALRQQDLFINSTLALLGCDMLWQMLTGGMIPYGGFYLNLKTKCSNPMPLEAVGKVRERPKLRRYRGKQDEPAG
ncbi:PRTRC system ThiF family protein [Dysgonomonas sp. GY75]|uniref:PRTRC system ThiF family protein n=1 Tax=Dysgonomonas sp. GY75 TaxID=2780419 RepID=UPI001F54A6DD|nr:PRTRC system ThiF family protein [Dysgonomonas sp. GY75]